MFAAVVLLGLVETEVVEALVVVDQQDMRMLVPDLKLELEKVLVHGIFFHRVDGVCHQLQMADFMVVGQNVRHGPRICHGWSGLDD